MKTRQECEISVTSIASNHLKTKILWFSDHKDEMKLSFRCDHMCLLALVAYLLMDVPENLKPLLFYRQETISHARWLTTASGYLRMFIFGYCVEPAQISRLKRMVSFIVCVYLPAFLAIHLKSSAAEGPSVVLFTRDLLLAYKEVDLPVFEAIWKHFVQHASQWLSPKNIALSVHAEVPPYTVDAVKEKAFPNNVDIEQALLKRKQLRDFFTEESKLSPCIACFSSPMFWKSIDNNNRSTERFIGRLKLIVNGMVRDDLQNLDKTDLRILATLHNVA